MTILNVNSYVDLKILLDIRSRGLKVRFNKVSELEGMLRTFTKLRDTVDLEGDDERRAFEEWKHFSFHITVILEEIENNLGLISAAFNNWLKEVCIMKGRGKNDFWQFGPNISGEPLGRIINVSSNNFRHYFEWGTTNGTNQGNINTLNNIGINGPYDKLLQYAIYKKINIWNYDDLLNEIISIGDAL